MRKNNPINFKDTIITIIFITANDEQTVDKTLEQINKVLIKNYQYYEILVVDNNSYDKTVQKIRNLHKQIPHTKIIRLSKTYGDDVAYTAGLDNCIGDYAVVLNPHLVSPNLIPTLLEKVVEDFDIAIANPKERTIGKWSFSGLFLSVIENLSTHDFRYEPIYLLALSRRAINSITRIRRKSRNLSYIAHSIGFKKTTIYFNLIKSHFKDKAPNFFEILIIVTDIIISNSFKPIRILAAGGMLVSLIFLMYAVFVAIVALFFNTYLAPKGWVTLASIMGIMFFLLFSLLTLISEYIIRILNESRNEPLYFIADEMDQSVINIDKKKLNVI